jgi:SAM-dependent methyltransferase
MADLQFRRDLYRGTAPDYDAFRVPYPTALTDDLAHRSGADGNGTLLDLACGTGQLTFALRDRFATVWAVDQEPDMVEFVAQKAASAGVDNVRPLVAAAEDLSAPEASFDLIALGNAFHRLRRRVVAANVLRWLSPGGYLALVWGGGPRDGEAHWHRVLAATLDRWRARADATDRVPSDYERERAEDPDAAILAGGGFELVGRHTFLADHDWTVSELIGHAYSTSVLSRAALGDLAPAFEDDMRRELTACAPSGKFHQVIDFAYELFRKPAS